MAGIPALPLLLSVLGLIPFVGGVIAIEFAEGGYKGWAIYSLPVYGALILSFLGGTTWGLALGDAQRRFVAPRLILAMAPSIAAWMIMFQPPSNRMLLLAACLIVWAVVDHLMARRDLLPAWYPKLRWPITLIAAASLVVGSFQIG
ncbi:MAG: DUF3429 domain-containing protein [Minwuia sp.]|nr:DUF3429 domain-containing protein [Minwuia sp.]